MTESSWYNLNFTLWAVTSERLIITYKVRSSWTPLCSCDPYPQLLVSVLNNSLSSQPRAQLVCLFSLVFQIFARPRVGGSFADPVDVSTTSLYLARTNVDIKAWYTEWLHEIFPQILYLHTECFFARSSRGHIQTATSQAGWCIDHHFLLIPDERNNKDMIWRMIARINP